jgi:hypothetical protein
MRMFFVVVDFEPDQTPGKLHIFASNVQLLDVPAAAPYGNEGLVSVAFALLMVWVRVHREKPDHHSGVTSG